MRAVRESPTLRPLSLEERLESKLKDAEYLLVLVLALMLWTAGFVDLFTHNSQNKTILGLYSPAYFVFLLVYSLGFPFWYWLIFPPKSIDHFKKGLLFIQTRAWVGIPLFGLFAAFLASMFLLDRWVTFPLLEASMAILVIVAMIVILVAKPDGVSRMQPWRRTIGLFLVGWVIIELAFQGLSFLRVLPFENANGMFAPYGRVYQNQEGFTNTRTNKLGWYYPDFRLEQDSRRIIFTGDSYLQGIQVQPEQNLGPLVEERIAATAGEGNGNDTEILGMGIPGYGPGLYLDRLLIPYTIQPVQPEEVVVFFHIANDFQAANQPDGERPYYFVGSDGKVALHENDFVLRHTLQHTIIRGYEPVNPVRTASTHLFTFNLVDRLLRSLLNEPLEVPTPELHTQKASPSQPFGPASFVFAQNGGAEADQALAVATGLLADFQEALAKEGVQMRLVTIPYFPAEFYDSQSGSEWDTQLGSYDLLLPEQRLREFANANNIPFLPLGQYWLESGATVEEVQSLFYGNGTGHFTAEGHEAVAQAVFDCFYRAGFTCPVP
jgi:hypothetical protein